MLETREREERRAREMSPLLLARAPPAPAPAVSALRKGRREERPDCVCAQRKPGEPPGSEHRAELKSRKLKSSEEQAAAATQLLASCTRILELPRPPPLWWLVWTVRLLVCPPLWLDTAPVTLAEAEARPRELEKALASTPALEPRPRDRPPKLICASQQLEMVTTMIGMESAQKYILPLNHHQPQIVMLWYQRKKSN